jgi:hypothetical protein
MNTLQMYIQYEIKESSIEQYQHLMKNILENLKSYDALEIQWLPSSGSQTAYIEIITLPTEAHYHALKKLRKSRQHLLFGMLDDCISGGLNKMDCFALKHLF